MSSQISLRDVLFLLCTSALVVRQKIATEDHPILAFLKDPKRRRDWRALEKLVGNMPLVDTWVFWVDQGQPQGMREDEFSKKIKKVGTFHTLQEFCDLWNSLITHHPLMLFTNVRLFKQHIRPMWEDPANTNGGKFGFVAPCRGCEFPMPLENDCVNDALKSFVIVAAHLIVGAFGFYDSMCGLVLSVRSYGLLLTIWNRNCSDREQVDCVKKRIFQLGFKKVKYQSHQATIENNLKKRLSENEKIVSDNDAVHSSSSEVEKCHLSSSEDVEKGFTSDDDNKDSNNTAPNSPEKKLGQSRKVPKASQHEKNTRTRTVVSQSPTSKTTHSILKHNKLTLHSNGELSDTVVNSDTDQSLFETDSESGHAQTYPNASTTNQVRPKSRKRLRFANTPTYFTTSTSVDNNSSPSHTQKGRGNSVETSHSEEENASHSSNTTTGLLPESSSSSSDLAEGAQHFTLMSRAGMALLLTASAALASVYSLYLASTKLNL